ncbi:hypothetical protein KR038_008133, partial [Drosophila bunnanda]
ADLMVLHIMNPLPKEGANVQKVPKDLGLETIGDAAQELALDETEEEEDGDVTLAVNPSSGVEPGTHVPQGAATQSP